MIPTFYGRFRPPWTVKDLPQLSNRILQYYLDPGVTIYCEQRLLIDEQIS